MTSRCAPRTRLWGADQAQIMFQVLDQLPDALWQTYGENLVQRRRAEPQQRQQAFTNSQLEPWEVENNDEG